MLSGVASDREVRGLAERFSHGELVRMLGLIQQTAAGFTRSTSRRMDAELCILNLCQPELTLDAESLNARLNRLEEQIRSGNIAVKTMPAQSLEEQSVPVAQKENEKAAKTPAEPQTNAQIVNEAPIGFWSDIAAEVRKELRPPVSGFFAAAPNAPVKGVLQGNKLVLMCANAFTLEIVNKPEVLSLVARKASAKLNTQIQAVAVDQTARNNKNEQMEQLLNFGRAHSDIVKIKEN